MKCSTRVSSCSCASAGNTSDSGLRDDEFSRPLRKIRSRGPAQTRNEGRGGVCVSVEVAGSSRSSCTIGTARRAGTRSVTRANCVSQAKFDALNSRELAPTPKNESLGRQSDWYSKNEYGASYEKRNRLYPRVLTLPATN